MSRGRDIDLLPENQLIEVLSGTQADFGQCLLLAQSGHSDALNQCPLLGGKADISPNSSLTTFGPPH
jgi:hypothetical protein